MPSTEQAFIHESVHDQLQKLTNSYDKHMMEHKERLSALEAKNRSSTIAPLALCRPEGQRATTMHRKRR